MEAAVVPHAQDTLHRIEEVPQVKRAKNPGIRIVGSRVYDSTNGRTCHQCRQKTCDESVTCKSQWKGRLCTQHFCNNCLLNRYSEKVEEVSKLPDWQCPRCRNECNCSVCRKKKGLLPTGILIHTAKATGHPSVKDFLKTDGKHFLTVEGRTEVKTNAIIADSTGEETQKSKKSQAKNGGKGMMNKKPKVGEEPHKETIDLAMDVICSDVAPEKDADVAVDVAVETTVGKSADVVEDGEKHADQDADVAADAADGDYSEEEEEEEISEETAARLKQAMPALHPLTTIDGVEFTAEEVPAALQLCLFLHTFTEILALNPGQVHVIFKELSRGGMARRGIQSSVVQLHVTLLNLVLDQTEEEGIVSSSLTDRNSWLNVLGDHLLNHNSIPPHWTRPEQKSAIPNSPLSDHSQGSSSPENRPGGNRAIASPESGLEDAEGMESMAEESDVARIVALMQQGVLDGYAEIPMREKLEILNLLCDDALESEEFRSHIESEIESRVAEMREQREDYVAARKLVKDAKEVLTKEREKEVAKKLAVLKNQNSKTMAALEKQQKVLETCRLKVEDARSKLATAVPSLKGDSAVRTGAIRPMPMFVDPFRRKFWKIPAVTPEIVVQESTNTWCSEDSYPGATWMVCPAEKSNELEEYIDLCRIKKVRKRVRVQRQQPSQPVNKGGFKIYR